MSEPTDASRGAQAEHLRRVVTSLSAADGPAVFEQVAVVLGAKGGVGASAATLAIARELAAAAPAGEGIAVLAVDAHPGRSDLAYLTRASGLPSPRVALSTSVKLGVHPPAGQGPAAIEIAKKLLRSARRWIDGAEAWAVIDAGVADSRWGRELASRAARPLLVTTPDGLSLVNTLAALKRLGAPAASRVGLLVNHCPDARAAEAARDAVGRACRASLGCEPTLAGWLPTLVGEATEAEVRAVA
ncbi:hypothetical protein [Botrimarina sp.]|uniref:hypothetical protein n=1 Tax=Botrimarina sp. TaxID=2795802 RepID=UPI0032EEA351